MATDDCEERGEGGWGVGLKGEPDSLLQTHPFIMAIMLDLLKCLIFC